MKSTINIEISEDELQYICEALLFASSCDIVAQWKDNHNLTLFNIAKKLFSKASNSIDLKNIELWTDDKKQYELKFTDDIKDIFNIKVVS